MKNRRHVPPGTLWGVPGPTSRAHFPGPQNVPRGSATESCANIAQQMTRQSDRNNIITKKQHDKTRFFRIPAQHTHQATSVGRDWWTIIGCLSNCEVLLVNLRVVSQLSIRVIRRRQNQPQCDTTNLPTSWRPRQTRIATNHQEAILSVTRLSIMPCWSPSFIQK